MFAIVGIPGSSAHRWRHFSDGEAAQEWLEKTSRGIRECCPRILNLPKKIVNDGEAIRCRWSDGSQIYWIVGEGEPHPTSPYASKK